MQDASDCPGLEVGHLIAVRTERVEDAPWIGRVVSIKGDKVQIAWMEGGYEMPWSICKVKVRRRMIEWRDSVAKCTIILYGIELDKAQKLKQTTIDTLKSLYSQYCK